MKREIVLLGVVLGALIIVSPVRAVNDLTGIYGGVVQYNNPEYDSVAMLDFTYSVERRQFSFYRPDSLENRYVARIFAQVDLIDSRGYVTDSASTILTAGAATLEEADQAGVRLFDRIQLFATPGLYSARVTVIDAVSKRKGEVFIDKIVVEPSSSDSLRVGGICLAYRVRYVGAAGNANPRLVRNGYEIVPNPLAVYAVDDSTLAIYSETYNLSDTTVTKYDKLVVQYGIVDDSGKVVRPLGMRRMDRPGNSAAIAENLDIKGLPAGSYKVRLIVDDPARGQSDTQLTAFSILAPRKFAGLDTDRVQSDPYDTLRFKSKVHLVAYLLTPNERQVFESLSDLGKENYLDQYWREHDPTPNSKVNETRREIIRRYNYVNAVFSSNTDMDNGWSTDRGRVYMTYGPWEERDQNPAPRTGNPYDIWHYRSIKEGKVFVFEDVNNTDDYQLVHSNVEGERFDEAWQERINLEGLDIY